MEKLVEAIAAILGLFRMVFVLEILPFWLWMIFLCYVVWLISRGRVPKKEEDENCG